MSRQRSMEVIEQSEYVTIGELVRLTGVRYSTLKFYTEEGMLPFEQVWDAFQKAGITSRQTEKIAYGNLFRVIEAGCGKTSVS